VPNLVTAKMLARLGVPAEKFMPEFDKMVRAGRDRLYALQRGDGGWGWFENDPVDPFMSACAVHGLGTLKDLGYPVDETRLQKGREHLKKLIREEKDLNRLAYMVYALGEPCEDAARLESPSLTPYATALLTLALHRWGRADRAASAASRLSAQCRGDHWVTENWYYKWEKVDIETTAFAIQALHAVDPSCPKIGPAVEWLLRQRQGNRWKSTKDTAVAIYALLQCADLGRIGAAVEREAAGARPALLRAVKASLNGGRAQELLIDLNRPTESKYECHFDGLLEENELKLAGDEFDFDVEAEIRVVEPVDGPRAKGMEVQVAYDRPLEGLRLGDEVGATVTLRAGDPLNYAMVLCPIPAGCEVIRGSGSGEFARFEDRFDKAIFFLRRAEGDVTLGYRLRCGFAGAYTVQPASASIMYDEAIGGWTGLARATIRE
jgi:uncharacterized protein YfaS (alpha-2-macroglobulin family)